MSNHRNGEDDGKILKNFRSVARSHVDQFRLQQDHVKTLLAGKHNYSSGVHREALIRSFLVSVLPKSISVDSGFVYGFDQIANSRQIDILVWDSGRHSAVFRASEFVIVPPEAVIAAICVKSTLGRNDIVQSLENLLSLTPLEIEYRSGFNTDDQPIFAPIEKIIVAYNGPSTIKKALETIGSFFEDRFMTDRKLANEMVAAFKKFDPGQPDISLINQVERVIPKLVITLDKAEMSLMQGWGPPEDRTGSKVYGPGLRRLPYMYPQGKKVLTPLERFVYRVLKATYAMLGTSGRSLVAAWSDIDPAAGWRFGDVDEVIESAGVRLLDPENIARDASSEP